MEENEIEKGVILKNITSNRVVGKLSSKIDEGLYTFREIPPYIEFDDKGNSSYKYLGSEKTTRRENIHKYSVRKRRNRKDKHFTLVWSGIVKKTDIRDIRDDDNIRNPETRKKYQMVTSHLRLPKSTLRNLRNDFNEFLYPTPNKIEQSTELFEILRQPYALDLIKHFSEKEEITMQQFKEMSKLGTNNSSKYLETFKKLGFLRSYKYGRNGINIYRCTLDKKKINEIISVIQY